jgi:hypothetical protein
MLPGSTVVCVPAVFHLQAAAVALIEELKSRIELAILVKLPHHCLAKIIRVPVLIKVTLQPTCPPVFTGIKSAELVIISTRSLA